jgi:dethiobiotin synthetase
MSCYDDNVATLRGLFQAPLLGEVPYLSSPTAEAVADCLDLSALLADGPV